ncbi:MAG: DJ-1/PfpI family protein [Bacillota bacterium]|nr:DJ-1/PfpI family protein [Bacillota bacterium]
MVYIHLATGFEEVEALTAADILRRAGIDAKMVSMTGERLVCGAHGMEIMADLLFEDADYDACEMIVLPGGLPGATNLEAHKGLTDRIREFDACGKKLAAICAAPLVFGSCGLLNGKRATIYPGMEEHLKGGVPTGSSVTVDGNIITGKGPALAMEFALSLVEELRGRGARDEVAAGLLFE